MAKKARAIGRKHGILADALPTKKGNIVEYDKENEDVLVNFMRAACTTGSNYLWPRKKGECWVPTEHILRILPVPERATGRHYGFDDDIIAETESLFRKFAEIHF
jgi:hypothetical protein